MGEGRHGESGEKGMRGQGERMRGVGTRGRGGKGDEGRQDAGSRDDRGKWERAMGSVGWEGGDEVEGMTGERGMWGEGVAATGESGSGEETWERGRRGCGEWGRLGQGDAANETRADRDEVGKGGGKGGNVEVRGDTERCWRPGAWPLGGHGVRRRECESDWDGIKEDGKSRMSFPPSRSTKRGGLVLGMSCMT